MIVLHRVLVKIGRFFKKSLFHMIIIHQKVEVMLKNFPSAKFIILLKLERLYNRPTDSSKIFPLTAIPNKVKTRANFPTFSTTNFIKDIKSRDALFLKPGETL